MSSVEVRPFGHTFGPTQAGTVAPDAQADGGGGLPTVPRTRLRRPSHRGRRVGSCLSSERVLHLSEQAAVGARGTSVGGSWAGDRSSSPRASMVPGTLGSLSRFGCGANLGRKHSAGLRAGGPRRWHVSRRVRAHRNLGSL